MSLVHALEVATNITYTENGAVTPETTGSCCLDLFATIGALRHASEEELCRRFLRAYAEDRDLAMKILFYARDVRGGLGERRAFRIITRWLADYADTSVVKNISNIPEYGRYDDLLSLFGTNCEEEVLRYIAAQWKKDMKALREGGSVSLLGKWMPSVNASNAQTRAQGKKVAQALHLRPADYRKAVSALRKRIHILENDLRVKEYTFDYAQVPSRALYKYRAAFIRNDRERYTGFMTKVTNGEVQMHTDNLTPYDIVNSIIDAPNWWTPGIKSMTAEQRLALDATWKALPDYTCGENALAVVDISGSMYMNTEPVPAAVAFSLGIYYGEKNHGPFKDRFITFSRKPQFLEIKGKDIVDKVAYCETFNEAANTDLEAVFRLILETAKTHQVPQEDMPARIYIISDMEFDSCVEHADLSNFRNMELLYRISGYTIPEVVFWNVNSRNRQQPVTMGQQGVALVSGCTPRLFEMIRSGNLSPYGCMLDILNRDRYKNIVA